VLAIGDPRWFWECGLASEKRHKTDCFELVAGGAEVFRQLLRSGPTGTRAAALALLVHVAPSDEVLASARRLLEGSDPPLERVVISFGVLARELAGADELAVTVRGFDQAPTAELRLAFAVAGVYIAGRNAPVNMRETVIFAAREQADAQRRAAGLPREEMLEAIRNEDPEQSARLAALWQDLELPA
jgi:hypothetical protein